MKKIIIVGASSGIGKELAIAYAKGGNLVGITARRKLLLDELSAAYPGKILNRVSDVKSPENINTLESLVKELGGLDMLIISAGIGEPAGELSWSIDKMTVETNINGFVSIANWAFNYFVSKGSGHLAGISSIAAYRGGSFAPAYNASKAFQSNYLEGLAIKARRMKKNITVTRIEPGFVDTKMAQADKIFWLVPVAKAVRQIISGLHKKRTRIYISRRWLFIAWVMKWMPGWVYRRIG